MCRLLRDMPYGICEDANKKAICCSRDTLLTSFIQHSIIKHQMICIPMSNINGEGVSSLLQTKQSILLGSSVSKWFNNHGDRKSPK